jgi:predicted nucleic acid-binding protein
MTQFASTEDAQNMVVSSITLIEGRSVLCRLRKGFVLTPAETTQALNALDLHVGRMVQQPSNSPVIDAAQELVDRYSLKAMDSLQLASAVVVRRLMGVPHVRFISSDKELLVAATAEGFETWDPAA